MIDTADYERMIIRNVVLGRSGRERHLHEVKKEYFSVPELFEIFLISHKIGFYPSEEIQKHLKSESAREELTRCGAMSPTKEITPILLMLKEAYLRRLLGESIQTILKRLPSTVDPLADVLEALDKSIVDTKLKLDDETEGNAEPICDILLPMFEMVRDMGDKKNSKLVFMGIPFFDTVFGGTLPGEMTVIGARPSVGKSSLALQLAINNSKADRLVLICSMEMTKNILTMRAVCAQSGVSSADVMRGVITKTTLQKMADGASSFSENKNLYIRECPHDKPNAIRREINRVQNITGKKIGLVVIDHIHIAGSDSSHKNRLESLTEISGAYKAIAIEYATPVFVLAQLTKTSANKNRKPVLSDLRECGAIEQDADRVILLHRIESNETGILEYQKMVMIVAKSRNGYTGEIPALFHGASTSFYGCNNDYEKNDRGIIDEEY